MAVAEELTPMLNEVEFLHHFLVTSSVPSSKKKRKLLLVAWMVGDGWNLRPLLACSVGCHSYHC